MWKIIYHFTHCFITEEATKLSVYSGQVMERSSEESWFNSRQTKDSAANQTSYLNGKRRDQSCRDLNLTSHIFWYRVTNKWSHTSTDSYVFMTLRGKKLPSLYFLKNKAFDISPSLINVKIYNVLWIILRPGR